MPLLLFVLLFRSVMWIDHADVHVVKTVMWLDHAEVQIIVFYGDVNRPCHCFCYVVSIQNSDVIRPCYFYCSLSCLDKYRLWLHCGKICMMLGKVLCAPSILSYAQILLIFRLMFWWIWRYDLNVEVVLLVTVSFFSSFFFLCEGECVRVLSQMVLSVFFVLVFVLVLVAVVGLVIVSLLAIAE